MRTREWKNVISVIRFFCDKVETHECILIAACSSSIFYRYFDAGGVYRKACGVHV